MARVSVAKPALRYVNTALTLILVVLAAILPSLSAAARINTIVVGLVLLALSAVSPVHGTHRAAQGAGPGGPVPPQADERSRATRRREAPAPCRRTGPDRLETAHRSGCLPLSCSHGGRRGGHSELTQRFRGDTSPVPAVPGA